MRIHKVYHRFSILHIPKQPLLLSSSPHFLSLKPTLRPPLKFIRPCSSFSSVVRAGGMRFRSIAPVSAAEGDGGSNGAARSSPAVVDYGVYHCFSILHIPKQPLLLSSSPHFLSLKPTLRPPLKFIRPCSSSSSVVRAGGMRFRSIAPVSAAEGDGGSNGAARSSPAVVDYGDSNGYCLPPPEIRDIVDAPPLPALSMSPHRDKVLFLKRRSLPSLSELARPEVKLAGIRIDGKCNSRSRMSYYTGIGIHQIMDDGTLGPEKEIYGLPDGAKINFVSWSRDGSHLAFAVRTDEEDGSSSKLRLWVADIETGNAKSLIQAPDIFLNAVFENFVWVNDSTLLVCTIPLSRGNPPRKPLVPLGPKIQSNEQKDIIQSRTYQDLLKDEYDEDLFDYYATSQLVLVSLDGSVNPVGPPAIYTSLEPSPDDKFVLIYSMHRPYSFTVPSSRFPKKVDIWTADGKFVREICDLPLAEDIPITHNSVRKGKRSIQWREDKPSTLVWVETQDGGDAKVEVSPRDIIYTEPAELHGNEQTTVLHKLDLRYGGISWCDDSLALVYESWYKTRRLRTWIVSPGSENANPHILFDRSYEDVYSDPGSPMLRRNSTGNHLIAKIKKEADEGTYLLLNGSGATPQGNIPFLDLLDINTGNKERIWESDKEKYYENVISLMCDQDEGDIRLDQLKVLTSKESKTETTQFYIVSWPEKKASQLTNFPHPYPQLSTLTKEMIRYQRKDGVQLTATLYLPPGYDPARDGPLPCLMWSYPGEFKSKDAASQVRGSPNAFAGIGSTSPLLWLTRGFAILSGPTIPIIGEGDEEANDRYVEQLVASAEAAVEEVICRGVAHPDKIAIGGHSYGAFMTANLLAHAPHLFCCGIARSGAYNRTLTPFGFQNEDRTLWEAVGTYVEMSPFISANKIKKPILLIHGEEDNNSGTLTMQSDRFFNALKGHGALCRLVVLPFESHSYSARESVMHVLWETDRWLQKYCVSNSSDTSEDPKAREENASLSSVESKAVVAGGGVAEDCTDQENGKVDMIHRSSLW
ncbi:Prolyl oligopeptidase family protein [Striga hermonthica]|uniref:Probable glutamyl endopeptidase, chloroplastic n=1 Tax=Striga hermonthica TaxID=68872 RepID=A0A9N7N1S7_STRHE|nr:Prolyl oligopeptidase family protein [Striga hermonthica]